MEDNIFVAKSGYLRIISELGIIGFVLYSLIFYNVYKKLNKFKTFINNSLSSRFVHAMQSILVLCLVSYFSRIYLESELLLFLALCNFLAFSKSVRSKNKIIYSQNILK